MRAVVVGRVGKQVWKTKAQVATAVNSTATSNLIHFLSKCHQALFLFEQIQPWYIIAMDREQTHDIVDTLPKDLTGQQ